MSPISHALSELLRRKVIRFLGGFLMLLWLLAQGFASIFPVFGIPDIVLQIFVFSGIAMTPLVGLLAWKYNLTTLRLVYNDKGPGISGPGLRWELRRHEESDNSHPHTGTGTGITARAVKPELSLAVLPFVNMSSDPEQEYFSDGLSEELINQLAQINALKVAGRTSSFAFKGKNESLQIIGEKLGVSYVLEGSVRKSGRQLRITGQLIDCSSGFHLWSDKFDRELIDVFAVQDEIAAAVAETLRIKLGVSGPERMPGGTSNIEAFDLMLQARALNRRYLDDVTRAVGMMRKAVTLDPSFALGWNVLGNVLTGVLVRQGYSEEIRRELDEALQKSMKLAPDLWTAHEAQANLLELRHDWIGAEAANARSRELAPGSMREPVLSRAHQLAIVGRPTEALPFACKSKKIEPMLSSFAVQNIAMLANRLDVAERAYEQDQELPVKTGLVELFTAFRMMSIGDHGRAKARLAHVIHSSGYMSGVLGRIYEVFDDPVAAGSLLGSIMQELTDARLGEATLLARFAVYFGEPEIALATIRRAVPYLFGVQITNIWDPGLAPMRMLPGFRDLVRELNLVTYWRTTGQWGEFARPVGDDDFEIFR